MSEFIPQGKATQKDSQTYALLLWIGTIVLGTMPLFVFVPALVVYLMKKEQRDDEFLFDHAREALNWSITFMLIQLACLILTVITFGLGGVLFVPAFILHVVFGVMAAVKANSGQLYRLPFCLRFVK